ncbi:MAG TPA: type VI secretion system tip protein VgrG [Hymenobacter sp.]|jgi:Rhs element Vgr protein|uniref:type VI secretion system tip protein VgrG n=1 Tax=Hymenobacter sp. TaxID=1898978 RepID=UPI002EDA17C0
MALPPSPLVVAGLASFEIRANGKILDGIYRVLGASVTTGINKISTASFEVIDGDPATGKFPVLDAKILRTGTFISIAAGYDNVNKPLFEGIIVKISLASQGAQGMKVNVECRDAAFLTSNVRKSNGFENKTTSTVLTEIIGDYGSLLTGSFAATDKVHEKLIQKDCSDWDFIVMQAEANGQVVLNANGKISTVKPSTASPDVLTLEYGINVYSISLDMDARTQYTSVKATGWNSKKLKMVEVTAAPSTLITPGSTSGAALAAAGGQGVYSVTTQANADVENLKAYVDAVLMKQTLAKIKGSVQIPGTALAVPACTVNLSRLGQEFSGRSFVSEVKHTLGVDWKTDLTLGMDEKWFAQTKQEVAPSTAAGSTSPPVNGLYAAVVKQIQADPGKEFRVQVTVPLFDDALWARLALPYASKNAGHFFYPEVDDEVILAFFGGDARDPVILGALHSSTRAPAYTPDAANTKKGIVTAAKLSLEFDDKQKILTLKTPGGNKLVISDAAKGLTLTDEQQNTITMAKAGITLESKSTLTVKAAKDLILKSTGGKVILAAATKLEASGPQVSISAKTNLELGSKATAKLQATGPLTVKGLAVLIN